MKKIVLSLFLLVSLAPTVQAQRVTDKLDRGLVAVPAQTGGGNFVSWRIFGEEYYNTEYNLYRDGVKLNDSPLRVSNFKDTGGKSSSKYQVAAVVDGVEQEKSNAVGRWSNQYLQFAVKDIYSRRGTKLTNNYVINDIALADVDGDGVSEFIMKRNYSLDGSSVANDSAFHHIECYNIKGDRLWYIDLGPNMVSGPDEQYDAVGYDWDGDGKAEILMRGADNMIIHYADGTTQNIGNMNVNTRGTVTQTANMTYTNTGAEYLLYLEGATGKPYPIGTNGALWMTYPLPRGNANDWGDGYGHRSTKHYFGAPFLDGRHPFIFLGRGCYTKHHMKAFSVDPTTHKLTQYWEWSNNNGWSDPYYGNGYHNFGIADVDWDGRDEIVFGSMVIDDNGKGLSTSGLGHGDAQHCGDFDPYRHGQEIFACNEDEPAMNYRDATTSKIYYRLVGTGDDGRALCGNFSNDYPGAIGHSSQSGVISCVTDKVLSGAPGSFTNNFRIYWDGDLLEEGLDGSGTEGEAHVYKADGRLVFSTSGTKNCNWTKNTPSAMGDILGDWREEIIVRTADNAFVRIYTTNIPTEWRNYTLWHDHQYRQGMVWETIGYNQPPHASYFIGELEGITVAPPPLTMTGRKEIANNGTIGHSHDGQHVMVCETNDTQIQVADGAKPSVATFNVPSWVQGTNSTSTTNPRITYTYYQCNVQGGAFAGNMRLVKQGDGILNLPAVDQLHSGQTDIWAGVVNFNGTMRQSDVWMNRFAELNSNGGEFKSISMEYDAKLRPGGNGTKGSITTGLLKMRFGSRIIFDIDGTDTSADVVKASKLHIESKNWQHGPKYLSPVFEFNNKTAGGMIVPGKYLIAQCEQIEGNLDDIIIDGLGTTHKATLANEDGDIYLIIEGMRSPTTIVWNGNNSNQWDLATSQNFSLADDIEQNAEAFVTGDKVLFDDSAKKFTVTLSGEIEADTVLIDNSKSYTFSGSGAITGNTVLVKRGRGALTIKNDNSYGGGTRISEGTVIVTSLSNSTQAAGNLGKVATASSRFIIENGAELRTTAAVTQGSSMMMAGEEGGVITNTADFITNRAISGTILTKKGAGWMKLNTSNSSLDKLVVAAGTVQCISCNMPAKTVEFQGGTLSENTSSSYAIHVPKGKSGRWNTANRSSYSNKITGEGTLTIYCEEEKGSSWYATRTQLGMNLSEFEGTIMAVGRTDDSGARFTLNSSSGMPKGTLKIADRLEVQNTGKTYRIGQLAGSGKLGGYASFSNNGATGTNTWEVGNDKTWSWSGTVVGNGTRLTKVGSGRMSVRGAWTNTGIVRVNEGELYVFSGASLGTGPLNVAEGATLSGVTSATAPLNNSSYSISGNLMPGSLATSTSGSIFFGGKNVTLDATSRYMVNLAMPANSITTGGTCIKDIGKLTANGTVVVSLLGAYVPQANDEFRLWECTSFDGTPTFELPELPEGLYWSTDRISEGILMITNTPTAINSVTTSGKDPSAIYDSNGKLVRRNATTKGLPRGIYFMNGRKIIIK